MSLNRVELERIRYWQGQLLASVDLETQLAVSAEMRRLHNQAVHQAYGIAIGLSVELDSATSQPQLDEEGNLTLGCGLAYDCAGRELILQSNRSIPLPKEFPATLIISHDETSPDGISLRWKAPKQVNPNIEIAITNLTEGAPTPKINAAFRPVVARPLARPKIATGQTIPGETSWQPWKIRETEVGVRVRIDTSAAGFTEQPHYFAEVFPGKPNKNFIPAWLPSIADPSTEGFTLQLMLRRIMRETLDIVDSKGMIAKTPGESPIISLDASGVFVITDLVSRVLPLAERAAVIKSIASQTLNLESSLSSFTESRLIAIGNLRRQAHVTKVSTSASFFEVTVDKPELFAENQVVAKLNGAIENTRPSRVVSIDNSGTLELTPAINGLSESDTLAPIKVASVITNISGTGTEITVADPSLYTKDNVVARLTDPIETSAPARIVEKKADGTLVLSQQISGLQKGNSLGVAGAGATVAEVNDNSKEIKVEVDSSAAFAKRDLVAKRNPNGSFSPPVRIERILDSKTISLSGMPGDLTANDILVAANFTVRATVVQLLPGKTVKVKDASVFSRDSYVAKINEQFVPSLAAQVNTSSGQLITLDADIDTLKIGDVIGLCSFPATVTVTAKNSDSEFEISPDGFLRAGDLIAAVPEANKPILALVARTSTNTIHLASSFPNVKVGDQFSVATIHGAIHAKNSTANKVEVDQPKRLRAGDFVADITGWRQIQNAGRIQQVDGLNVTLDQSLDGLLLNDIVGLASLNSESRIFGVPLLQIRLNQSLGLSNGDEVLLVGFDRLTGETQTASANVVFYIPDKKIVFLVTDGTTKFTFRPEDVSGSVLFVSGSAMSLINKLDLFVSWVAVGDSELTPRACDGDETAECDCS